MFTWKMFGPIFAMPSSVAVGSDNAVLVHGLLGAHKGDSRVGMRIGDADADLPLETGLFVGEVDTLHGGGAKFGEVTRKRGEHEHRRLAGAEAFQRLETLLGRSAQVLGHTAVHDLLVPVAGGTVALDILAFAANLELHPAHHILVHRVLLEERLQLVGVQEARSERLDGDILGMAAGGRVLGIGEDAEHGLDTVVHGPLLDKRDGTGKFHALAVFRGHVVFQEPRREIQGLGTLMFTQVAFREDHGRLGTLVLAEAGLGNLLEDRDSLGALALADKFLGLGDLVLRESRRAEGSHKENGNKTIHRILTALVLGGSLNHVVLFLDLFLHGFRKLDPVDDIDPEGQPAFGERLLHGRHRLEGKGSLGNDREIEFRFGSQVNPREAGAVRPDFQPLEMEGEDALDGFQLFCF